MSRLLCLVLAVLALVAVRAHAATDEPPTNFEINAPTIITTVPGHTLIVFNWKPSTDPEGGLIRYRLLVWQGYYVVAEITDILETHYSFDVEKDAPTWQEGVSFGFDIQAVDSAGNRVFGWQSTPYDGTDRPAESATVIPAYLWGYIYDSVTGDPVANAVVYTKTNVCQSNNGAYGIQVQPGTVTMTVTASGYTDYAETLTVAEGDVILRNVALRPEGASGRAVVWGTVLDSTVQMPVSSAVIYVDGVAHEVVNGSYMISVDAGVRRFRCEAVGFATMERELTLQNEEFRNETLNLSATAEHAWLERDGVRLGMNLSGMQSLYDLYVVAIVNGIPLSLRSVPYGWSDGILPLASNVPLFTARYQLQVLPDDAANLVTGAMVYACLVKPGTDPLDASNWVTIAVLNWDKPGLLP